MRPQLIVGAVVLGICTPGCQLTSEITQNLVFATCLRADEIKGKVYYRMLARTAWNDYLGKHPEMVDASDFAKGFKLGYADYLESGGNGSAHPLPPIRYWKIRYETPEGRAATVHWLKGFQVGAAVAKASGYRNLIIVPIKPGGLPPKGPPTAGPNASLPGGPPPGLPAIVPSPADDLPVPRLLPAVPLDGNDVPAQAAPPNSNVPSDSAAAPAVQKQTWQAVEPEPVPLDVPRKLDRPTSLGPIRANENAAESAAFLEQARKAAEAVSFPSAPENDAKESPALFAPEPEAASTTPNPD